ncbi:C40 family peptidase [Priestia aryabhattai]|nr:C40 family peptidase [Priestia aryabhattai]
MTDKQADVNATAKSVIGTHYVWEGIFQKDLGSRGFINYVFGQVGIDLSKTHRELWKNDSIHIQSPKGGGVVFFEGIYI